MKNNRRGFLKKASLLGLGASGMTYVQGCGPKNQEVIPTPTAKEWASDPEWLKVKYGAWSGPGVPVGPGPMDDVLVKDYAPKSTIIAEETFIPKAKFSVIDAHVHHYSEI